MNQTWASAAQLFKLKCQASLLNRPSCVYLNDRYNKTPGLRKTDGNYTAGAAASCQGLGRSSLPLFITICVSCRCLPRARGPGEGRVRGGGRVPAKNATQLRCCCARGYQLVLCWPRLCSGHGTLTLDLLRKQCLTIFAGESTIFVPIPSTKPSPMGSRVGFEKFIQFVCQWRSLQETAYNRW